MLTLTPTERQIYLRIRAEQIKEFHDTNNRHQFIKPYPIETAMQTAATQLDNDLENGKLRISMQDLLILSNDECQAVVDKNIIKFAKSILSKSVRDHDNKHLN